MARKIRLNEDILRSIIRESLIRMRMNESVDEGFKSTMAKGALGAAGLVGSMFVGPGEGGVETSKNYDFDESPKTEVSYSDYDDRYDTLDTSDLDWKDIEDRNNELALHLNGHINEAVNKAFRKYFG